ncbi:hypothetical protein P3T76_013396 [Phytophthora citrophthora]|uniref:Uncharacterized protein n=1 Tax=Phytophthora citrophthora TaxID=4793 RepID=A0AAD9LD49_9STRA|nr:hypothetical protein P3T76_013396 [Phytophthora citrophthora]
MTKRVHCEETSFNDGDEDSPPVKIPKPTSICEYCNKTFTSRGMSLHQRKCFKKLDHDKAEAKKTKGYKFCFLNESVHEEILSYLSNQTLTKMQRITGDHYDGCEPELAKICCKCENDNISIIHHLCRQCVPRKHYRERVGKKAARIVYGVNESFLYGLPCERSGTRSLFERTMLEKFMLRTCGSKKEWLRQIVKVRTRRENAIAAQKRRHL